MILDWKRWFRAFYPCRRQSMSPEVAEAVKAAYAEVKSANVVIQRIADEDAYAVRQARRR